MRLMTSDYSTEDSSGGQRLRPIIFNILAIFFLILTCLCPGISLAIYASPNSLFNPLPPRTAVPPYISPTATLTPLYELPPTWTPTETPTQTNTPELITATRTPTQYNNPGATEGVSFPFGMETGSPTYQPSPKGCGWLGVAGVVYDASHSPLNNLFVDLGGKFLGQTMSMEMVTGPIHTTPGGEFEFRLADKPTLSLNSLWLQVLDANKVPLSDKIVFNTYEGCDRNLVQINFVEASP
jgi:hypothetical protein